MINFKMKRKIIIFTLMVIIFSFSEIFPIKSRKVYAHRTYKKIKIDGILNEEIWNSEYASGFTQSDPNDGSPSTQETKTWVVYDSKNLYIAAFLYDPDPKKIISRLGRRDDELESDWFYFTIDPYFDKRSGFIFGINPSGSIIDGTLFNDEERDLTWDGIWESAARTGKNGWYVEMKIPYNQLRFKKAEQYLWAVNFTRIIKRKNETSSFSWVSKEESGYVSHFAELIGIKDIKPARLFEFLPFIAGNVTFEPEEKGNPFKKGEEFKGNFGFDLKVGLKSNLTLNITVNPDFGQVEVDPAVINISDQETYYQEKRPFFIEGADIFRFGNGGANVVRNIGWRNPIFFYSRRIGRSPQGSVNSGGFSKQPDWTRILSAVKISGKSGKGLSIGLIGALTGRENTISQLNGEQSFREIEPVSLYGVLRVKQEFNGGRQALGIMATSVTRSFKSEEMENILPQKAFVFALDGWITLNKKGSWVLTGWLGNSIVHGEKDAITRLQLSPLHYFQRPDVEYLKVNYQATSLNGLAGRLFLNKQKGNLIFNSAIGFISPEFNCIDAGYYSRGDLIQGHIETGYQIFHPDKIFRSWKVTFSGSLGYDFGGNKINENYILDLSGQFLNYWSAGLYMSYDPTRYNHVITRGGPMSEYPWGFTKSMSVYSDNRKKTVVSISVHHRQHPYGAYNYSCNIGLKWKPSSNFSLEINPGYSWRHSAGQWIARIQDKLKTETYGQRYVLSDIIVKTIPVEFRINWTFSPKLSLQGYIQPYIAVGNYFNYKEWEKPGTFKFDPYLRGNSTIFLNNGIYTIDPDGAGPGEPFLINNPDFNLKSLRGTIVLRWEYRSGSTLHFVWTQNRMDHSNPGQLDFFRDFKSLLSTEGDNIFMIKLNYRFNI